MITRSRCGTCASGAELHTLSGHTGAVKAVAVTADGRRAVSASVDGTLKVWDLGERCELHTLRGHAGGVLCGGGDGGWAAGGLGVVG